LTLPATSTQKAELRYLASLVQARQLSQNEIARATGVHQSQISRILAGQYRRRSRNVVNLCKYAFSLRHEESSASHPAKDALFDALFRIWDGSQEHANALIEVLEAIGTIQELIRDTDRRAPRSER
jgi:transcriptional regulator with XRE-family HTH domain